jgi:uncharacterized protein YciI
MNQYLYTVQVVRQAMLDTPTEEEQRIAGEHLAYMQGLMNSGIGIFAGGLQVRDSRHFGLMVYQAENDESAKAILHHDPAVKNRIMRGRWFPYRVALWNAGAMHLGTGEKHYLYHIQPVRPEMVQEAPTEFESKTVSEHFMYLKDLTEKGVFCLVGRSLNTDYSTLGIGVLKASSEAEAWAISEADPAIIQRVMRLDLLPFGIAHYNQDFDKS